MAAEGNDEAKVLLVIVDGEPTWWVFRPLKPLTPDWQKCRGHWMHPISDEDASELRVKQLLDTDELAFEKRGLTDEIPRFAAFRANVCLRRVPKTNTFVMCGEDVSVANEEYAAREADIASRERKGESVVIYAGDDAPQKEKKATPQVEQVVAAPVDVAAVAPSSTTAAATREPPTTQPSRFYLRAVTSKGSTQLYIEDSEQQLWFERTASLEGGVELFSKSAVKRPPAAKGNPVVLRSDDVQIVQLSHNGANVLFVPTVVVEQQSNAVDDALPLAKAASVKRVAKKRATPEEDETPSQAATPTPSGSGSGPSLRVSLPSRLGPRSEVKRAAQQQSVVDTSSLLSCAGYKTWTIREAPAALPARAGALLSSGTTAGGLGVYSLGDGQYVTTSDAAALKAAVDAAPEPTLAAEAAAAAAAPDVTDDSYLEDLFACVKAVQQ